jgi:hypothetical protein
MDGPGGPHRSDYRGSGKRLWRAVLGQTQCRDVDSYVPEPRRSRQHAMAPPMTNLQVEVAEEVPELGADAAPLAANTEACPNGTARPATRSTEEHEPSDAHSSSAPIQIETL